MSARESIISTFMSFRICPSATDRYYVASARGFFTSDKPEEGWVRAENGLTRDYFHDFLFLPAERDGEQPTMLHRHCRRIARFLAERKSRRARRNV